MLNTPTQNNSGLKIFPVDTSSFDSVQAVLEQSDSKDYYQSSIAYYAITGRDGLWAVQDGSSCVLFCRHPNKPKCMLLFPPVGAQSDALFEKAVHTLLKMGEEVQMARFENAEIAKPYLKQFLEMPETLLDWIFPVRTLSTENVSSLVGNGFQHVRQKINHLKDHDVRAVDLNPGDHRDVVELILNKWAEPDKHRIYFSLLDMFYDLSLSGRIVMCDEKPVGFSIWEETSTNKKVANAYAHIGLHEIIGMSQYVIVDMCRTLHAKGFEKVCLGGSEDEGLDRFKRKFCPVDTVSLVSLFDNRFIAPAQKQRISA